MRAQREYDALVNKLTETGISSSIGLIAFGGSIAYGLDTPDSDIDLRGFYLPTAKAVLIGHDTEQIIMDNEVDACLYSYAKVLTLLGQCNPNVIELLGLSSDSVLVSSPVYDELLAHKDIFVSRRCAKTFGGYATQQLRRIKNALSRESCSGDSAIASMEAAISSFSERYERFGGSISVCLPKGMTDADDVLVNIACENVPVTEIAGIHNELSSIAKNAKNIAARNRKKDTRHLAKHMSHLIRLFHMGSEMLETGAVNTKRVNDRDLLMDIKLGKWVTEAEDGSHSVDDAFWELLAAEETRFKYAKENTALPDDANWDAINELLRSTHAEVIRYSL